MNGQTNRRTSTRTGRQTLGEVIRGRQTVKQTDRLTEAWAGQTNGQTNGWTSRRTDRQTLGQVIPDRRTVKQTGGKADGQADLHKGRTFLTDKWTNKQVDKQGDR